MAAVTVCGDFGAQDNKVCYCFHFFLIYLPQSDGTECHDLIISEKSVLPMNLLRFIVMRYLWLAGVCALIFIQLLLQHSHFRHV